MASSGAGASITAEQAKEVGKAPLLGFSVLWLATEL